MLIPYEVIKKKRDGGKLTKEEIRFMVNGFTDGSVKDYQMSSFLMACFIRELDEEETAELTLAMMESGDSIDVQAHTGGFPVDKHSTGGVGDKVSIPLAPAAAACGAIIPMMSGRGLGHTGGTLDKLESIPGFRTDLTEEKFLKQLKDIGTAMIGQTAKIAPADKKMYALRDVTATVDSFQLITGSILSKKLAEGALGFVFDVKTGSGAFMQKYSDAKRLAESMFKICKGTNRKCVALITDMDQPLGTHIGNSLEIIESIEILHGRGPEDTKKLVIHQGAYLLLLADLVKTFDEGKEKIAASLNDGSAFEKFCAMVEYQGGDVEAVKNVSKMPAARITYEFKSPEDGYITQMNCYEMGMINLMLGGGRQKSDDEIDYGAGIVLEKKVGSVVKKDDVICVLYTSDEDKLNSVKERLKNAVKITQTAPAPKELIYEVIT